VVQDLVNIVSPATGFEPKIGLDKERMVQKSVNGVVNRLSASLSDLAGNYCLSSFHILLIYFWLIICMCLLTCISEMTDTYTA
jgi:hypothetical protein